MYKKYRYTYHAKMSIKSFSKCQLRKEQWVQNNILLTSHLKIYISFPADAKKKKKKKGGGEGNILSQKPPKLPHITSNDLLSCLVHLRVLSKSYFV